jgi:uncharacterized protein (DUF1499 family)
MMTVQCHETMLTTHGVTLMLAVALFVLPCCGKRPKGLGVVDGRLTPCPGLPNCISSQSQDANHRVEPFQYEGSLIQAKARLLQVIEGMARVKITAVEDHYIHAEFTSKIFRFVDDVEFYFDRDHKIIHVRSASRVGYSDLGVNRRRVEKIRQALGLDK